jgi:hypothetical protein
MSNEQSKKGTTYNLATSREENGKKIWDQLGTLFIRSNGSGGILYLKTPGGPDRQIAVFPRKRKDGSPSTSEAAA